MEYLTATKIKPFIIFSDINIPKINGMELNETSDKTALIDLENQTELGVFVKDGEKKGTSYKLKSGGYMADIWRIN